MNLKVALPPRLQSGLLDWSTDAAWGGGKNQGIEPHTDAVCQPSWAQQIRGRKHWRLHVWDPTASAEDALDSYPAAGQYDVVLEPGEVLVFYMWVPHATFLQDDGAWSVHGYVRPRPGLLPKPRISACGPIADGQVHSEM